MKVYMVWPQALAASYYSPPHYAKWGRGRGLVANLALPTLAALTPADVEVELCDADIAPVDYATDADVVALSGFYVNWRSMREIATEFRKRGKIVAIGGPFATLSHTTVRPYADVLFRGEAERTWPRFIADFQRGEWRDEYHETEFVDLAISPVPRWDLVRVDDYAQPLVQTARGCPYSCDFCDVITMYGRQVRSKAPERIVTELDLLHRLGARFILLADDNLTAHKGHARRTLTAIREWNRALRSPVSFATQLSIDLAWDDDLMSLAAEAGLVFAYIGIESVDKTSLASAGKQHNARSDLVRDLARLEQHGIVILGGLMSGFDTDTGSIFRRQHDFIQQTGVTVVSCNLVTASEGTPLYERVKAEGRLVDGGGKQTAGDQTFNTNLIPKNMSLETLIAGNHHLISRLYTPTAYRERFERLMRTLPRHRVQPEMRFRHAVVHAGKLWRWRGLASHLSAVVHQLIFYAKPRHWRLFAAFLGWMLRRPGYLDVIGVHMTFFAQFTDVHRQQGIRPLTDADLGRLEHPPHPTRPTTGGTERMPDAAAPCGQ